MTESKLKARIRILENSIAELPWVPERFHVELEECYSKLAQLIKGK